jgi:radical SAM superfamily enzyme YgiQ (UPF0313 family)
MSFKRPEILRPPSEHDSYFLPLTVGCSNNTCAFCRYYGSKLQIREFDEIKREIDAMDLYVVRGMRVPALPDIVYDVLDSWDGRRVFLQDGDALVYPFPKLKEILEYLNEKFPRLERIGSYATPRDILQRTVDELRTLRDGKLGILYMGVESGDADVLEKVCKGADRDQIVEAGRKIKEAGITLSVTVILGLGGKEGSEKHAQATARILTDIDPDYVGALTLTLVPGTLLYKQYKQGEFALISPFDSLRELKTLVENSRFTSCFLSSMHASNYLAVRGTLPGDKAGMLGQLDNVLTEKDSAMLRPEYFRGL